MVKLMDPYGVERVPLEGRGKTQRAAKRIQELKDEFPLATLMDILELPSSTYSYHLKQLHNADKIRRLKLKSKLFMTNIKGTMVTAAFIWN